MQVCRKDTHVEDAFKQMKHPHFLGWQPMFHWTDSKIQVHAFYCVLALLLTSLLQRELARHNEHLSINRILEELGGIRETLLIYSAVRVNESTRPIFSDTPPHLVRSYSNDGRKPAPPLGFAPICRA